VNILKSEEGISLAG